MPLARSYEKPRNVVQRFRHTIWAHPSVELYVRHPSTFADDMRCPAARAEMAAMALDMLEETLPFVTCITGRLLQP